MFAVPLWAEPIRIATYNTELSRRGPGQLLGDILAGKDEQVTAVVEVIALNAPDIIVLQGIDWDAQNAALAALGRRVAEQGHLMPHLYASQPNSGLRTGLDHDGDGRNTAWRDAQGFGRFTGEGGMAVMSRFPILGARDFTSMLWQDLPDADLPRLDGALFPNAEIFDVQRLSSVAHWDVTIQAPDGPLNLLTWHATPPVFDGPEDRNGRRNADEMRFWAHYLNGELAVSPPAGPVVVLGDANLDPADGDGLRDTLRVLLEHPRLQHTVPRSDGGVAAANPDHTGDPALDTADWPEDGPGNLRVSYILPSTGFRVLNSGVFWPAADQYGADLVAAASRHRLVWVDLELKR
ncbi:endonuclease/exonuclease/phosphatase family protein [Actibacterium mucosum]|uniref:endonuclease/exonuclease/phosphatase family protein n=1 Tax=Actibacterium mucosum TaxID=1087332 RepID=UPI00146FBE74|nr:endonuclease/exonuclease/phosphatase family protein [Actibacterium mucosum]